MKLTIVVIEKTQDWPGRGAFLASPVPKLPAVNTIERITVVPGQHSEVQAWNGGQLMRLEPHGRDVMASVGRLARRRYE